MRRNTRFLRNGKEEVFRTRRAVSRFGICGTDIVVQINRQLLLNGTKLLYEGVYREWSCHPDGVVVQQDNRLLLNGQKELHRGQVQSWELTGRDLVIDTGAGIFLIIDESKFNPDEVVCE